MRYLLFLAIILFILWLVRAHRPPTQRQTPTLLPEEDALFSLSVDKDTVFHRCERALREAGAEVRTADPERGLFTANFPTRHPGERLLIVMRLEEIATKAGECTEVSLDYRAESHTADHHEFGREKLAMLVQGVRAAE